MKKIIGILLGIIVLVIISIVGLYYYNLSPVKKSSEEVQFVVQKGSSTKKIIDDLYNANLIRNKLASTIYVKLNKNIVVKAGTYVLNRKDSTQDIFSALSDGLVVDKTIKVTFVEGKRLIDYVDVICKNFPYTKEEVLKVLSDEEYLKELINKYSFLTDKILDSDIYYPLEGYLFPAMYQFYEDDSIKTIIEKMLAKTQNVLDNYNVSLEETPYSIHEILTMASIIENETMMPEDRSVVSQVIYTRLNMNMSLGMDVTTYYAVRKTLGESLTRSDLNSKNAYNTRNTEFIGLPVGPICNPSEASIKAALNPSDTDYIYFYADIKTGKLHFAKTHSEFQELIKKYS